MRITLDDRGEIKKLLFTIAEPLNIDILRQLLNRISSVHEPPISYVTAYCIKTPISEQTKNELELLKKEFPMHIFYHNFMNLDIAQDSSLIFEHNRKRMGIIPIKMKHHTVHGFMKSDPGFIGLLRKVLKKAGVSSSLVMEGRFEGGNFLSTPNYYFTYLDREPYSMQKSLPIPIEQKYVYIPSPLMLSNRSNLDHIDMDYCFIEENDSIKCLMGRSSLEVTRKVSESYLNAASITLENPKRNRPDFQRFIRPRLKHILENVVISEKGKRKIASNLQNMFEKPIEMYEVEKMLYLQPTLTTRGLVVGSSSVSGTNVLMETFDNRKIIYCFTPTSFIKPEYLSSDIKKIFSDFDKSNTRTYQQMGYEVKKVTPVSLSMHFMSLIDAGLRCSVKVIERSYD